jgi:hypothetical protein
MGFDPDDVPLVREASRSRVRPVTRGDALEVVVDGAHGLESDVDAALGRKFKPPRGWRKHLARSTPDRPEHAAAHHGGG